MQSFDEMERLYKKIREVNDAEQVNIDMKRHGNKLLMTKQTPLGEVKVELDLAKIEYTVDKCPALVKPILM